MSLCNEHQESILHALWLCDQAKAVWKSVLCFARLYQRNFRLVMDLVEAIMEQGSAFTVALFSTIAWSLWERRNRIRENQPSWPLHEIGNKAKELVLEFFDVHKQVPIQRHGFLGLDGHRLQWVFIKLILMGLCLREAILPG